MQYTNNLNLSLPSSDNAEDLADISVISNNFQKIDDFVDDIYSEINEFATEIADARILSDTESFEKVGDAIRYVHKDAQESLSALIGLETVNIKTRYTDDSVGINASGDAAVRYERLVTDIVVFNIESLRGATIKCKTELDGQLGLVWGYVIYDSNGTFLSGENATKKMTIDGDEGFVIKIPDTASELWMTCSNVDENGYPEQKTPVITYAKTIMDLTKGSVVVDQVYNAESENAQSGVAVAQAVAGTLDLTNVISSVDVTETFDYDKIYNANAINAGLTEVITMLITLSDKVDALDSDYKQAYDLVGGAE